ncbi:MAG: hypothetical protein BZY67_01270 [SAR202 cluster bacterium Io17-Chloro-G1]|nr:MAG: hypothetical protein BZY67_01270 [SAR202 cluster bacterium Io17-Chloro-G1]
MIASALCSKASPLLLGLYEYNTTVHGSFMFSRPYVQNFQLARLPLSIKIGAVMLAKTSDRWVSLGTKFANTLRFSASKTTLQIKRLGRKNLTVLQPWAKKRPTPVPNYTKVCPDPRTLLLTRFQFNLFASFTADLP